jgi:hypothetical protein
MRWRHTATITITFPAADCTIGTAIIATITARLSAKKNKP